MKMIIGTSCFGIKEINRMSDFFDSLIDAIKTYNKEITIVLPINGEEGDYVKSRIKKYFNGFLQFVTGFSNVTLDCRVVAKEERLKYSSIMKNRLDIAREHIKDEDAIYVNIDNDYHFNKHFLSVIDKVLSENKDVHYISMLRPCLPVDMKYRIVELSGIEFIPVPSILGGAFAARWSVFKSHTDRFFFDHKVTGTKAGKGGMFDNTFFDWVIKTQMGTPELIYCLYRFSLIQHCNLESSFLDEKHNKSKLEHTHGMAYDPKCNPWEILGVKR